MKNFMFVSGMIVILAVSIVCSSKSLSNFIEGEYEKLSQKAGALEVVYASYDLGFVLEETNFNNSISYKKGNLIVGECVYINGGKEKLNYIADKLGLTITNKYSTYNKTLIEGVSPILKYYISGRQENVQIALSENVIVVGSPIIYGSY